MDVVKLEGSTRETGRHAARQSRHSEQVPCILYGGKQEPVAFQVPAKILNKLIHSHEQHRFDLFVGGMHYECILKEVAFSPRTNMPVHADFQVLQQNQKVTLTVPIRFVGSPVGQVEQGGDTTISTHELHVSCLPKDIPAHIDVDISGVRLGESLHVSDLPQANLDILDAPAKTIVTVLAPRVEVETLPETLTTASQAGAEEESAEQEG